MKQRKSPQPFNGALGLFREFPTERECHDFFAKMRWPKKIECPHCRVTGRVKKFRTRLLYFCGACRKQFTVRIGTIFEDSPLSLQKWFYAVYMLTAHKKGISSHQLARDIGTTQKTAWHILHRIRFALDIHPSKPLDGHVEVDEAYIGGAEQNKHLSKRKGGMHGGAGKPALIGMLDRDDKTVVTHQVRRVTADMLHQILPFYIHPSSTLHTDEAMIYRRVGKRFADHQTVHHADKEYVNGESHTNTLDGFWSLLKRGLTGIYHQVSSKHLFRYADEFEYRYNNRKMTDRERFNKAMSHFKGRLMYKTLIS